MFRICLHQLKLSMLSPKFYIALMVGVVIQTVTAVPLLEYVKATGQPICLVEGFLYYNSDIFSVAAASLGIVLMVSDIPFSTQNETYTLMRVSRKRWIGGKVLYLLCACTIYYLVMFAANAIYMAEYAYWGDFWSQPIYKLVRDNSGMYQNAFDVSFRYGYLLAEFTPFVAFAVCIGLSISHAFVMSLLIFWLNLKLPTVLGYFIAIILHVFNYCLIAVLPLQSLQKYSLLASSCLIYHRFEAYQDSHRFLTFTQSWLAFAGTAFVLILLTLWAVRKYDFKITVGTKQ